MQCAFKGNVFHDDQVTFFRQLGGKITNSIPLMRLDVNPGFAKHRGNREIIDAPDDVLAVHPKASPWRKGKATTYSPQSLINLPKNLIFSPQTTAQKPDLTQ